MRTLLHLALQGMDEPPADCDLCPRLLSYRRKNQAREPGWFNAPVPGFGSKKAALLVVGLAPGVSGANRTGRPFTGDYAGDLLYATLLKFGFATGIYEASPEDSLKLRNCRISNAVRCVPPENKPTPEEATTCRTFLQATLATMLDIKVIIALGRIAHESTLRALNQKLSEYPFTHAAEHQLPRNLTLIDSYHCSRYNTNTRRLTTEMFETVFARARALTATA